MAPLEYKFTATSLDGFQVSAQPMDGKAASLIEDENYWVPEHSLKMLWERFSLRGVSPTLRPVSFTGWKRGWRQPR